MKNTHSPADRNGNGVWPPNREAAKALGETTIVGYRVDARKH